jgi:hypothetical protein
MNDRLISLADVSKILGISRSLIYKYEKSGYPEGFPVGTTNGSDAKNAKKLYSMRETQEYLQQLLDRRRTSPIDKHAEKKALPTAGMSKEERAVYENRSVGRADDYVEEGAGDE